MNQDEKLAFLGDAYKTKPVEDLHKEIVIINEALTPEQNEAINAIQFKLNDETGSFELDYEIMQSACSIVGDLTLEEVKKSSEEGNSYELADNAASVYTGTRLAYLNIYNQDDISVKMKEYNCDIATACAVWYEDMTALVIEMLIAYILQ